MYCLLVTEGRVLGGNGCRGAWTSWGLGHGGGGILTGGGLGHRVHFLYIV